MSICSKNGFFCEQTKAKYVIGNERFATKGQIQERCREIASRGNPICLVDLDFLAGLLPYHHEWPSKSAPGVVGMEFRWNPHHAYRRTRTLYLLLADDSEIDISWVEAVRDIPTNRLRMPNELRDFKGAARATIADQIDEFRSVQQKKTRCAITGENLDLAISHVDHVAPRTFDWLLFDFCCVENVNPLYVEVGSKDGIVPFIADPDLRERWSIFHAENAILQMVTSTANLTQKRLGAPPWDRLFCISKS